jgi:hypothetical protein
MSRSIGRELPRELFADLDGSHLDAKVGLTILLITTDEAGWPCVALLSVGEVVARTTLTIRLALWPGTTATRNLSRTGRGTLAIFGDGRADYIRIDVERDDDGRAGGMAHAHFEGSIAEILRDEVTYARMTSGITFELGNPSTTVERWRATVAAMLADEPPSGERSNPEPE